MTSSPVFILSYFVDYTEFSEVSETVLDQLYQVYQESHESDPPDIRDGFRELDDLLRHLPLEDNNTVFNLCCSLCTDYEHKAFLDGLQYGAHLMKDLFGMHRDDYV